MLPIRDIVCTHVTVCVYVLFVLQLSVSVVHSDYRADGEAIEKTVVLEFVLLETSENCSTLRKCDFERSCDWQLGVGTRIVGEDNSPLPQLSTNTGKPMICPYM